MCCQHSLFLVVLMLSSSNALKIAILTGSTRTSGPPRPILGPRVARFLETTLRDRGHIITTVIDPRQLTVLEKPHFAFTPSQVPLALQEMHDLLQDSDGYVTITPEFNHGPSPGLLNSLNHFGSSVFGFKPSVIVSYSPSQWGGVRAAHSLRPILSELGCLPVSAMIHIPKAHEVLNEDGTLVDGSWLRYVDRSLSQLEWWADAARNQRIRQDPYQSSPAFRSSPTERNAPS